MMIGFGGQAIRVGYLFCSLASGLLPVRAEIMASSADGYQLRHSAECALPAPALWNRLIHPENWWSSDHTYSGDAKNLSLDAQAGGLWREDWKGGSVVHGSVLSAMPERMLRLDAPFGPLQAMAVKVIWTITLKADEKGCQLVFDEVASGNAVQSLDKIAPAVDSVKAEALRRLNRGGTP